MNLDNIRELLSKFTKVGPWDICTIEDVDGNIIVVSEEISELVELILEDLDYGE